MFNGYLRVYKNKQQMSGGEQKDKQRVDDALNMMDNLRGKGNKNKHPEFTNIIAQHQEKKKQNNDAQNKKNIKKLDDDEFEKMYGITKLLNKLGDDRRKVEY
jgi:hypothetical protein